MSKNLFIIYTPYQLISAVNIIKKLNIKYADCLILHKSLLIYKKEFEKYFSGTIYFYNELTEYSFGEHLFFRNKYFIRISILLRIIYVKKFVKRNRLFQEKYDELYVPSDEAICRIIYKETLSLNPQVSLNLIDDGVGTYVNDIFVRKRWISRFIYSLFLTPKYSENIKKIFCYYPDLIGKIPVGTKVYQIKYDEKIDIFHCFVDKYLSTYIGKEVIFLDQGKFNEQSKKVLLYLAEIFGNEKILIKKHPRISGQDFYRDYNVTDDGLPFEAIVSETDCSSCLLVSHSSTGCITPYLLLGIKPDVIFYYCMDNADYKMEVTNFINKINAIEKEEYINVPKSMNEFKEIIRKRRMHIRPICLKIEK